MIYEVIRDSDKIKALRNEQVFTVFKNPTGFTYEDVTTNIFCDIHDLHKYVVEDKPIKEQRQLIEFNPFRERRKTSASAYLPHTCMIDVDIHNEEVKKFLIEDMGSTTFGEAFRKLFKFLKNDECCFYIDTSHSHRGIKCLFNVISDYYLLHCGFYEPDGEISKNLMSENYKVLLQYLKDRYNITIRDKNNYIDGVGGRINQGIYSSWGKNLKINPDASIIYYKCEMGITFNKPHRNLSYSNDELTKQNNEFSRFFTLYMHTIYQEGLLDEYQEILDDISKIVTNYEPAVPLLFSLKYIDDRYLVYYYNLFRQMYNGNSIPLNTVEGFKKFVHRNMKKGYIIPISRIFHFDRIRQSNGLILPDGTMTLLKIN